MENIKLVIPSMDYEKEYFEMLSEWENTKERIYPGAIRPKGLDYPKLLKKLESYKHRQTCPDHLVPSDTFFLVNNHNKILGAISLRYSLNEDLLKFGGHIGYGIRPSERKKGYAKAMLKMALENYRNIGMQQVLITCNKDNVASAKTILSNGGILENELAEDTGNIVQRYWIEL